MKKRQTFDTGDIVEVRHQAGEKGIIIESVLVHNGIEYPDECIWHIDEYHCKVRFFKTGSTKWIRPKWLQHLSKIK